MEKEKLGKHARILVVCEAGEDRSVVFATLLKKEHGYDNVLNCGIAKTMPDTFAMLAKWADRIFVPADMTVWRRIPHTFRAKAKFINIGFDIWQSPCDPRLIQICRKEITKLGL